jgi:hypothetical protein
MGKRIQRSEDVPTFRHSFAPDEPDEKGRVNIDWVEMKAYFRLGDRDAINSLMFVPKTKFNPETGEDEMTGGMKLDTSLANVATLRRAIVAWGGDGFETDGEMDEITLENVAGLGEDDARELVKALQARNPKAVGPKEKASVGTPATSTSAS